MSGGWIVLVRPPALPSPAVITTIIAGVVAGCPSV